MLDADPYKRSSTDSNDVKMDSKQRMIRCEAWIIQRITLQVHTHVCVHT